MDADEGRGPRGPRARRPARPGAADARPGARRVAQPAADARRPGLRGRGRAGHRGVHPRPSRRRRPAGLQISDFEEYCRLYRDAWCEPAVRWLLSTVPTAMIFDDHDVIDDWNTSRDWVAEMRATGWWDERIVGGLHVLLVLPAPGQPVARGPRGGRLLPRGPRRRGRRRGHRARLRLPRRPRGGRRALELPARHRPHAHRDDGLARRPGARRPAGARWSTPRSGTASRSGRAATSTTCCSGPRSPSSWGAGCTTWRPGTRRSADGAWGALASARGRAPAPGPRPGALGRVRRLAARARAAAGGRSPPGGAAAPPGSVVLLSGDVHHAYVAEARPTDGQPAWQAPVYQAVCSPLRNPLDARRAAARSSWR